MARRGARRFALPALGLLAVTLVVAGMFPSAAGAGTGAAAVDPGRPDRVLILSLPAITWSNLPATGLPNLRKLLETSAVADLSNRTGKGSAQLGDGYATINAGTRASTDRVTDGDAFEPGEHFGNGTAGEAFRQRTGRVVDHGLVHLGIAGLVDDNADLLFDAKVGDFGDTLAGAGFSRAVIANADGTAPDSPPTGPRYRRTAVTALIGSDGTVPAGAVGPELLEADANAPFGVRLDIQAVDRAFNRVWKAKSVVLVEASDLVRADAARSYTTSLQRGVQVQNALQHTDALVGSLLEHVDLSRDAVVVVGAARPSAQPALTIAAVHAPGYEAGLLKSGTTRRPGFVSLTDVAPTVLEVLGVDRPETMEGRAMKTAGDGGSFADRVSFFVHSNDDGLFRDKLVGISQTALIGSTIVFAIAAAFFIRDRRARVPLQWGALVLIGFPIATFFASPRPFRRRRGRRRLLGVRRRRVVPLRGGVPARRPARPARPVDRRARCRRRDPGRRPPHRDAARVQRGVRLLADRRDPVLRARQPRVRRAHGQRGDPRGPARLEDRPTGGHAVGDRHARGHCRGDRVATVGPGLRRHARRDPRLRAPRLDAPRAAGHGAHGVRPARAPRRGRAARRVPRPAPAERRAHPRRAVLREGRQRGLGRVRDRPAPQGQRECRHALRHGLDPDDRRRRRAGAVPLVPPARPAARHRRPGAGPAPVARSRSSSSPRSGTRSTTPGSRSRP